MGGVIGGDDCGGTIVRRGSGDFSVRDGDSIWGGGGAVIGECFVGGGVSHSGGSVGGIFVRQNANLDSRQNDWIVAVLRKVIGLLPTVGE